MWRQLRGLGAIYLQGGCCVLPRIGQAEADLAQVAAKVREFGGEATLSVLMPAEPGWHEHMAATANAARDEEYQELIDTTERFEEEVAREERKGKFTFAVLEEMDGDKERLERWFDRVQARDVFSASLAVTAQAKLSEALRTFDLFAERVHQQAELHAHGANQMETGVPS